MALASAHACRAPCPSRGPAARRAAASAGGTGHGTGWQVLLGRGRGAAPPPRPCISSLLPSAAHQALPPYPLDLRTARPRQRGAVRTQAAANGSSGSARLVLEPQQRSKLDMRADSDFYSMPRFVHHLDTNFRAQLTQLYRERIPEGAAVLDLCSSWCAAELTCGSGGAGVGLEVAASSPGCSPLCGVWADHHSSLFPSCSPRRCPAGCRTCPTTGGTREWLGTA